MIHQPGNLPGATWAEGVSVVDFIERLRASRDAGYGFVPLAGAGLSAPSGVPILSEIQGYLRKCIAMALGLDRPDCWRPGAEGDRRRWRLDLHKLRRWLPGRDDWPPFGDPQNYTRDTVDWMSRIGEVLDEMLRQVKRERREDYPELDLLQEAYGAAAEWRTALLFLSRLRLRSDAPEFLNQLRLGPPDLDIVDTFFLNVVLGKRPTLGHRMLARLAGPLRINTALTTNFDDLLERALEETDNLFTVFDVHVDTGLPPYRDMQGKNALVKLHGGRYGLRADYSLDLPPTDDDLRHFVSYFADRPISAEEWYDARRSGSHFAARRHLLVVGVSAGDERINIMVRAAIESLSDFQVFWVAYRSEEVRAATKLLQRLFQDASPPDSASRFAVVRHKFQGLLFLEIYQVLMSALPASGAIFPSAPRLPVPPELIHARGDEERLKGFAELVHQRIDACFGPTAQSAPVIRTIIVHGRRGDYFGAVSAAARVFEGELDRGRQSVWIDLDEVSSCTDLFEMVLHTVARKAGIVDWLPVVLQREHSDRSGIETTQMREIARITNNPHRQWVVFLNARSGAGVNLDRPEGYEERRRAQPNGWLDLRQSDLGDGDDPTASGEALLAFLMRVSGEDCPNVAVVLLCYSGPGGLMGMVRSDLCGTPPPLELTERLLQDFHALEGIVERALEFSRGDDARRRFLYSLCLANKVRYAALFWSWTFHAPGALRDSSSRHRIDAANSWLTELEERHVIRRKLGGFIWMHCDIRNALRQKLSELYEDCRQSTAEIHHGLAEWYRKLLVTSDEPLAAFEVVYHRCRQVVELLRGCPVDVGPILEALTDARRALHLGRHAMLAWGFTKGLCRRLAQVRDDYLEEVQHALDAIESEKRRAIQWRIDQLRFTSLRLNRAIAREVGENTVAFERHLELREAQYNARTRPTAEGPLGRRQEGETRAQWARRILHPHLRERVVAQHQPFHESATEWIDSCDELGILGNAVRAFGFARKAFAQVYQRFGFPQEVFQRNLPLYQDSDQLKAWWSGLDQRCVAELGIAPDDRPAVANAIMQVVGGLLHTFQRHQQLCLAQGIAQHTLCRRRRESAEELKGRAQACFQEACRLFEAAMELSRRHDGDGLRRALWDKATVGPPDDWSQWFEDRQRLETQHAQTLAFLRDFEKAHRRLNEAEAALNESGQGPHSMERAIIELHRADVLTHQAVVEQAAGQPDASGQAIDFSAGLSLFGRFRAGLLQPLKSPTLTLPTLVEHLRTVTGKLAGGAEAANRARAIFAKSLSFVDDAWQTLSRAEPVLRPSRKNVWWTTWFFELKLKLVELRLFATLPEYALGDDAPGTPPRLPQLGLEFAPYGTLTLPERLLDSTQRIVRLDLFRMARVLESYANCLLALALSRELAPRPTVSSDSESSHGIVLRRRQEEMRERLIEVGKSFDERIVRRERLDKDWEATKLDEAVAEYVKYVRHHVRVVARLASEGLVSDEAFRS